MYPYERSLVKRLADKPFALLGINSDDDKEKLQAVMEEEQITWRSWWDSGSTQGPIQAAYNLTHWPTIYLIDHRGVIRHIDLREEKALDEAINQLLDELDAEKIHHPPARSQTAGNPSQTSWYYPVVAGSFAFFVIIIALMISRHFRASRPGHPCRS
jgi:hypothetical protein